jgi:hypothetical protein
MPDQQPQRTAPMDDDYQAPTGWQNDGSYVPCTECGWVPPVERNPPPGVPIRMGGTVHYGDCPTVPRLSPSDALALRDRLAEMDRVRRRGAAEARNYVIG